MTKTIVSLEHPIPDSICGRILGLEQPEEMPGRLRVRREETTIFLEAINPKKKPPDRVLKRVIISQEDSPELYRVLNFAVWLLKNSGPDAGDPGDILTDLFMGSIKPSSALLYLTKRKRMAYYTDKNDTSIAIRTSNPNEEKGLHVSIGPIRIINTTQWNKDHTAKHNTEMFFPYSQQKGRLGEWLTVLMFESMYQVH